MGSRQLLTPIRLVSLTTTQRNALSGVATGDKVYNTTLGVEEFYNGTAWEPLGLKAIRPYSFTSCEQSIAIPNNVRTPIPFTLNQGDSDLMHVINASSTTIAAGSNAAVLPQGTINVASTTGFATAGYGTINGPPGATVLTVFKYTGVTGTSFTGCTLGTGTMATSQVVKPANFAVYPVRSGVFIAQGQVTWAASPLGMRGLYIRQTGGGFDLEVGRQEMGATNTADQGVNVAAQPAFSAAGVAASDYTYIDVLQTSGGVLNCTNVGILSPGFGLIRGTEI